MKAYYLKHYLLVLFILALPIVAAADSHFTTDPNSGLDWLNLGETAGMEYNAALTSFPGWRHATNAEVEALFHQSFPGYVSEPTVQADVATSPPLGTGYPNLRDQAKAFIASYGPSYTELEFGTGTLIQRFAHGVYKDEDDKLTIMGALNSDYYGYSQVIGLEYVVSVISAHTQWGIYLVRGSTTPSDVTPPFLVSVTVDPQEISTASGEKGVRIEVSATDAESGVAYIEVYLDDPGSEEEGEGILLSQSLDPAQPAAFADFLTTFSESASEGIWLLSGRVRDAANNWTPIIGGYEGVPFGVLVSNEHCDPTEVKYRKGPFKNVEFRSVTTGGPFVYLDYNDIRDIRGELRINDGWDNNLVNTDYQIRRAYCDALSWKKQAKAGDARAISIFEGAKQRLRRLIWDRLNPRAVRISELLSQVEQELQRSVYEDLLSTLVGYDSEDQLWKRHKKGKGAKVLTEVGTARRLIRLLNLYIEESIGHKVKPHIYPHYLGVVHDALQAAIDLYIIFGLVEEDLDVDNTWKPFLELWLMRLELSILIEQYDEQREEYYQLYDRLKLN